MRLYIPVENDLELLNNEEYLLRLFNTSDIEEITKISINGKELEIKFTPFEAKGFILKDNNIKECNLIGE